MNWLPVLVILSVAFAIGAGMFLAARWFYFRRNPHPAPDGGGARVTRAGIALFLFAPFGFISAAITPWLWPDSLVSRIVRTAAGKYLAVIVVAIVVIAVGRLLESRGVVLVERKRRHAE